MPSDVSISSIDLLQSYNHRIKDFNSAVNTVMYVFRNQIEKSIEEGKYKLAKAQENHSRITNALSVRIQKCQNLLDSYNWDGESLNAINNELNNLTSLQSQADNAISSISHSVDKLTMQLNQLMQTASAFSLSNQSLLDSNIARVDNVVAQLNQYKEQHP